MLRASTCQTDLSDAIDLTFFTSVKKFSSAATIGP